MKQNFGLDGSSADFMIGKEVQSDSQIQNQLCFHCEKRPTSRFVWTLKFGLVD